MNVMNPEIDSAHLLREIQIREIPCGKRHSCGAQEERRKEENKKNR
jgi:hypothetical protein